MRVLFLFLALASFGASAQSVYKCVGKGGVSSFQSEPCSGSEEVKKVWDATPQRLSNEEQWRLYHAKQKAANDAAYLRRLANGGGSGAVGTSVQPRTATGSCERAKRDRDSYYANNPKRSYSVIEQWSAVVRNACK
jgi:hypothetical protein